MNPCFDKQSCSEISTCASTSGQSGDDPETGSNAMSIRNKGLLCIPHDIDLNPARMVIAELVGTFILMLCVCGIMASTVLTRGEVGLLEYAATAGLTIIVLVYSIGPISGAHVNPAVTIAFAVVGHFPLSKVPFYIMAQTAGSVLGTYIGILVYGIKSNLMITRPAQDCASAFWVELLATSIIVFLAASLACQAQCFGNLSGFVVGVAIGLAVLITGPVSGGSMNPARSLGPAIVSWNFSDIWIYIIGPTIGAVAGGFVYRFLRLRPRACSPSTSPNTSLLSHSFMFVR
ncbi:putative aquaporin NIP7-1 [Citrus sinensis]|nr:putative aquaporin NIP7-1 [Citrus sinensis]